MDIVIQFLLLVIGFVMLVKGADWFVDGAAGIAEKFGIPQLVIGLTIVAMGTSAPEAAVSITAALKDTADITIGNVVGSNILNVLLILGVTSVIVAIAVGESTVKYEIPYLLFVSVLLFVFGYTGGRITFVEGVILWVAFIVYLIKKKPIWLLIILVIIGVILIVKGSDIAVSAATKIALAAKLSERFIGLTIVALGTSLPELVTSVTAAKKGKADIAIGNIVGSNMFNIMFVVGTTALITPVPFAANFIIDMIVSIAAELLLWICVFKKHKLNRAGGAIMLACYAAYFVYLMMLK